MAAILVTGAGGFIGRTLTARLGAAGRRTIALGSTLADTDDGVLRSVRGPATTPLLATLLRNEPAAAIVHLAAHPDAPLDAAVAERMFTANLLGTLHVLEAAAGAPGPPPRVVLASSIKVYGAGPPPTRETDPVTPTSAYAIAKAAADQLGGLYHAARGVPVVVLRLTQVYGPHQPPGMLVRQLLDAAAAGVPLPMTAGEQTRDLLYIDDVVEAFIRALDAAGASGRIVNVGTGIEVTIRELVTRLHALLPGARAPLLGALPYRENEMWRQVVDPTTARALLGFTAAISLDEGLRRTVAWHRTTVAASREIPRAS